MQKKQISEMIQLPPVQILVIRIWYTPNVLNFFCFYNSHFDIIDKYVEIRLFLTANIKIYNFRLKAKSLPLTDAFNFQKRISRGLRKGQPLQHKNSQRLLTLPTNLNGMMTFYGFSCSFEYLFATLLLHFIFRQMANNLIVCCQK